MTEIRLMIDTNVILDILLKSKRFFKDSNNAVNRARAKQMECFVSASAVTDIFFILQKKLGANTDNPKEGLERMRQLVTVVDVMAIDIQAAMSDAIPDFEDAVIHTVAARINADYILTRNFKDFTGSTVPILTPKGFLKLLNSRSL